MNHVASESNKLGGVGYAHRELTTAVRPCPYNPTGRSSDTITVSLRY